MSIKNKLAQRKANAAGIKHCTFNPDGPGVVRIHLIPPKFRLFGNAPYIVILNGYYLLPLGYAWAILLSAFIDEVNRHEGAEIDDACEAEIIERTLDAAHRVYPGVRRELFARDLDTLLEVLFAVATGQKVDVEIEKLSIRAYAGHMTAPHRMDLMISAMTDAEGHWRCNQKCIFCYAAGQKQASARELSTEEWKTAIDRLRDAGVPMVTFTGGEPTMRGDLVELVEHAKWFVTRVNTNGVLLTPELARELRGASLDSLQVTLYSADEGTHNALVNATHFADTVAGIRNAVEAGLDVSVNTPLCRKNADYLSTLQLIYDLGVRFVTVSGLICTGTASATHGDFDLSTDELSAIVRGAKEFCNAHGMEIDFTSPGLIPEATLTELGMNVPACGAALSNMAVTPDGTVVPCQSWLSPDAGLGNLLSDRFDRIWRHPNAVALRRMSEREALACPFRTRGKEANNG